MTVGQISLLVAWLLVTVGATLVIQMVINAIGSLFTEIDMLRAERIQSTKSLAKNVFALNPSDLSILCASVKSKWISTVGIMKHDQGRKEHYTLTQRIFSPVDD